jgi:histone deacetylase 1/2
VGGGGYTLRNVPRAWVYETGLVLNEDLPNGNYFLYIYFYFLKEMPQNEYIEYFAPEYKLHLPVSNMENLNSKEYLESIMFFKV